MLDLAAKSLQMPHLLYQLPSIYVLEPLICYKFKSFDIDTGTYIIGPKLLNKLPDTVKLGENTTKSKIF